MASDLALGQLFELDGPFGGTAFPLRDRRMRNTEFPADAGRAARKGDSFDEGGITLHFYDQT